MITIQVQSHHNTMLPYSAFRRQFACVNPILNLHKLAASDLTINLACATLPCSSVVYGNQVRRRKHMDYSIQLERDLEDELDHCQSRYALFQEMANIATSQMSDLETKEQSLISDLKRLRRARTLFSPDSTRPLHQDESYYTPRPQDLQEQAATNFVGSRESVRSASSSVTTTQETLWPD